MTVPAPPTVKEPLPVAMAPLKLTLPLPAVVRLKPPLMPPEMIRVVTPVLSVAVKVALAASARLGLMVEVAPTVLAGLLTVIPRLPTVRVCVPVCVME